MFQQNLAQTIQDNVRNALAEDIGTGDLTANLIPAEAKSRATIITRQVSVLCGSPWFEACFLTLDKNCKIKWLVKEGELAQADQVLCEIEGNARAMLSAERPALNFLQTLSATATLTRRYATAVAGTRAKIMDTRKTVPSLRLAQKYAVRVGGGHNQRIGLFDGVLIKENHIAAAGGIAAVMKQALAITPTATSIQIEVENFDELKQALDAGAKLILLDNFSITDTRLAVEMAAGRAELEASGGISLDNVRSVAKTGVDRISIGALTKDIIAIDLSMRFSTP